MNNFIKKFIDFSKKEKIFLFLAIPLGLVMVFLIPPFEVPDEWAHYYKSWEISEGQFYCSKKENEKNKIPLKATELPAKISAIQKKDLKFKKGDSSEIIKISKEKPNYKEKIEVDKGVLCGASFFGFLPQAFGLKISKLLNFSLVEGFYFGRIMALLSSVVIIFYAIKIAPFGKNIFLMVSLLPMTVQQLASFSYDALHISLVLFFIAYILKASQEESLLLSNRKIVIIFLLSIIALNIKFGYFLLSLLIFMIPVEKFKTMKKYLIITFSFVLVNGLSFFMFYKIFQPPLIWKDGVTIVNEQINFVLSYPLKFIMAVFTSINDHLYYYFESSIGIPGHFTKSFPGLLYLLIFLGLFIFISKSKENRSNLFNLKQRLVILVSFLSTFFLIFFVLYLNWTPVSAYKVDGVQGRYLLSILPLLILFFYKIKIKKEILNKGVFLFWIIAYLFVFSFVFQLYWGVAKIEKESEKLMIFEKETTRNKSNLLELKSEDAILKQTFFSPKDDLQGIRLYFSKEKSSGHLSIYLKDEICERILRATKIDMATKKEKEDILFGIIPNSKNKKYCIEIIPEIEEHIDLILVSGHYYEKGFLLENNVELDKDLRFDILYEAD